MPTTSQEIFMPIVTFPSSTPSTYDISSHETQTIQSANIGGIPAVTNQSFMSTTSSSSSLRLAPVFEPSKITILVEENEGDTELTKLHAFYTDNLPGTVTYLMKAGDPRFFRLFSEYAVLTLVFENLNLAILFK